ncbi:hypothetical protein AVEN_117300-1 [Araneus ventricosus]|uniref:DDE-1 domain-containing protein n=1 Tax=Araneus ventricosus TaxID=182803 RepID=A0A4Y2N2I4_ARAVE|nr:hypothetical protein AVEN_117300-1 [Araneus ventricosus]
MVGSTVGENGKTSFSSKFMKNQSQRQDQWIEKEWPKLIASYAPKDVYNADESGFYYRAMLSHTHLFKGESTKGHKVSKKSVTILCYVSTTGEKEKKNF